MYFRSIIITVFLSFQSILILGQTYSTMVTDKEIYSFLDYVTKHDKRNGDEGFHLRRYMSYNIMSWDSSNFFFGEVPKEVSENQGRFNFLSPDRKITVLLEEKDYLINQFLAIKDTIWHKKFTNSVFIKREQKKTDIYYYSIPLFSKDKQTAIVNVVFYCGNMCAHGGYRVYKKVGDKWILDQTLHSWIS